jgi:hypothetical protein
MTESVIYYIHYTFLKKEDHLNIINKIIQTNQIGAGTSYQNLTIFPLVADEMQISEYLTLDEALAAKTATVTEVSESGSVPELCFQNEGDLPVLLLDGEELVGAKQNRVLNLTILAPPHEVIKIPVSCVEQGRWSHSSKGFHLEDRVMFSRGRSNKAASVSRSMASEGSRRSDQSEVWQNISSKSGRFGVSSPTDSMSDIYEDRKSSLAEFVGAFSSTEFQVGAIFGIDDSVAGIDLFDSPGTFSKLMPKLIRSYALDAIETVGDEKKVTSKDEIDRFIKILSTARVKEFPAVGLGNDLRVNSHMISGGALVKEGHVIHLGAFPLMSESSNGSTPRHSRMMRSSQRRRTH